MAQVDFRSFTPADAEIAPKLFVEALQTVYPDIQGGEWTHDLQTIPQSYQQDGGDFLMGEVDGKVVAEGGIHRVDDTTAEMKRLAVSPDAQEGGIGQKLVTVLEERARELGFSKMVLDTTLGQEAARHIYDKSGYTLVDRKLVDHPSGTPFDTFFYEKLLLPSERELFPILYWRKQEVADGEYKLLEGSGAPVQIREGQIFLITEGLQLHEDPFPGVHSRGIYNGPGGPQRVVSFLYHKKDSEGRLENTERTIILTGIGYGEHPGHKGQEPSWYLVGPQIGTHNHETGQPIITPEKDGDILTKHFSLACITDGPFGKPVLANPAD